MTINSMDSFIRNIWDWKILDGCFGGKIRPTDLDGLVERNGFFLILEAKSEGKDIPIAQKIMFDRLCRMGKFTVIILWGKPGHPTAMLKLPGGIKKNINIDELRDEVKTWFQNVNNKSYF